MNPLERFAEGQRLYDAGDYAGADRLLAEVETVLHGSSAVQPVLRARGLVCLRLGEPERALRCYEAALRLDPSDPEVHYRLALYHLARGDYLRGFAEYEWRLRRPEGAVLREAFASRLPQWDGRPVGKALLIHAEQGFGDTIQFARFLPQAAERVGRLFLVVHTPLVPLFATSFPGITLLERDALLPEYAVQCSLLSLPQLLGTTLATLPAQVPYLVVPASPFSPQPPVADRRRVGLIWRAKPPHGGERTAVLEDFRPLLASAAPIDWISLQKDPTSDEQAFLAEHGIEDTGSQCADFLDVARLVKTLDLVIAVDTAVAHLAGALAKPVWILVPKWSDWRWLLDRADSPWYPTARLFRQKRENDWSAPIEAIRWGLVS